MKLYRMFLTLFVALLVSSFSEAQLKWYNPMDGAVPNVHGRAWNTEIGSKSFSRFPARAESKVSKSVWYLSHNSAGLYLDFYCNAPEITVKYTVSGELELPNLGMIPTSGLDLYVTDCHGVTSWCACPAAYRFGKDTITYHYRGLTYHNFHKHGSEYHLYLPLYNSVTSLSIGIDEKSELKFAPLEQEKPILVYGTSIAQGASASRPAMAWTNIIQRRTGSPVINLGFSGSALMEPGVYDLINEVDAQLYILDCMPNMYRVRDSIVARTINGVHKIRAHHTAPILLVEHCGNLFAQVVNDSLNECNVTNRELRKAYEALQKEGVKDVYYLTKEEIGLTPDSEVDGWHPTDVGMEQYADAYMKKINTLLDRNPIKPFPPCVQRREPDSYEWAERHNAVIEMNRTTNPEILMIGNSIMHYWAGAPLCPRHSGPVSWAKLFGKRHVTNMGFGWDRIENVFWRLYHGELDGCSPKYICMMVGTNNLGINTNEDIVKGIVSLVYLIRERQPQARLNVIKIYPRRGMEQRVKELNDLLQQELVLDDHTALVDVTSVLTLNDGSGKIDESLFSDGLHPNEQGYGRIATVLKKYLK